MLDGGTSWAAFWHLTSNMRLINETSYFGFSVSGWKGTSGFGLMFWEGFQVLRGFKTSEACASKQESLSLIYTLTFG